MTCLSPSFCPSRSRSHFLVGPDGWRGFHGGRGVCVTNGAGLGHWVQAAPVAFTQVAHQQSSYSHITRQQWALTLFTHLFALQVLHSFERALITYWNTMKTCSPSAQSDIFSTKHWNNHWNLKRLPGFCCLQFIMDIFLMKLWSFLSREMLKTLVVEFSACTF